MGWDTFDYPKRAPSSLAFQEWKHLLGNNFVLFPSSEEPDEKKLLAEDAALASAQLLDGDMQVNQAAYNYNAWYQATRVPKCHIHGSFAAVV
ncbi:hypothetical protein WISP_01209 [Willisornis vidua]|uniref:Uncharacterized protein n=1 Tax=Willisornis vidua TaxID=1566151 RepID=A0ABQ9DUL3_9PASS|nr:hypothetical protein WISP_01209 [Willisornis vidua]